MILLFELDRYNTFLRNSTLTDLLDLSRVQYIYHIQVSRNSDGAYIKNYKNFHLLPRHFNLSIITRRVLAI